MSKTEVLEEKPASVPICLKQISHELACYRTCISVVRAGD